MKIELSKEISKDYISHVSFILEDEEFLSLAQYVQHQRTTRLMHSINVSYLSWFLAKKLHCDEKAAARAGLLHDFCPYDFKEETPTGESQVFFHPKAAAENSIQKFDITQREVDAILTHMFPLGNVPSNKEAWILTVTDKVCAVMEFFNVAIALERHNRVAVVA